MLLQVLCILFTSGALAEPPAEEAPKPPEGMAYVPAGDFIMGSNAGDADEMPAHTDTTHAYFIDLFEVSNAEFQVHDPGFTFPEGRENHAAKVTWNQAAAYAQWAGKRLPTEKEWEKAARGTDGRTYPWGETYDTSFIAWDENDPRDGSIARPRSPYGCADMAGSAWEWCAGWYAPYPGNPTPCEAYGKKYRVMRGGASFNGAAQVRTTHRYYLPPDTTGGYYTGFRCVKDVSKTE